MRTALAALAICLCACGGGHHHAEADPHPVDAHFARLVGSWSAVAYASTGNYTTSVPNGTAATFEVDDRGHLTGALDCYLSPIAGATDQFQGSRPLGGGFSETMLIEIPPSASPADGFMANSVSGGGGVHWHLTPITAPG